MTSLRNIVQAALRPAAPRQLLRAVLPEKFQARLKSWLNAETNVQWCRVVMNAEIERFILSLNCHDIDAVEISGTGSQGKYEFRSYSTLDFPAYDVCDKPLSEEAFDLVIAEQVLEHVLRPDRAASNIFKMLRPGGVFIVGTPFLLKVHEFPVDLYRWTERGMRQLLEDAGFDVLRTASWGNRECLLADMTPGLGWTNYNPQKHSLENEPQFAIVVWAFAKKPAGE